MKYPDEITVTTTPESDKAAGQYNNSWDCRLCQAIKLKYPDAAIYAGTYSFDLDGVRYKFDNKTSDAIQDGYNGDCHYVRPDAEPVTLVARRVK